MRYNHRMIRIRPFATLVLALVIALTSMTMAVARQYDSMGVSVVICTEVGDATIVLDVNGNPMPFTHPCPDCVAAGAAQMPAAAPIAPQLPCTIAVGALAVAEAPLPLRDAASPIPSARDPPAA